MSSKIANSVDTKRSRRSNRTCIKL